MEKGEGKEKVDSVISQLDFLFLFLLPLSSRPVLLARLEAFLSISLLRCGALFDSTTSAEQAEKRSRRRERGNVKADSDLRLLFFRFRCRAASLNLATRKKEKRKCPRSFGSPRWTRCDAEQE